MANFTRIRLPGFWIAGSVVDPEEFEALDAIRELLPNFGAGSTHAPTAPIVIGGEGLRTTGLLDVDGPLAQDAASDWELSGAVDLMEGSVLTLRSGGTATMQGGYTLAMELGSNATVAGNITWQANNWPRLTSRAITRSGWRIAGVSYTDGGGLGPDSPTAWLAMNDTSTAPALQTIASTSAAGRKFVVQLLDLPPGATLSTVTISTRGTAGDAGVNAATYTLFRWKEDTFSTMSAATPDDHVGADWLSDRVDTVVTCTSEQIIDGSYNYGIMVTPPYGTTPASMLMYAFTSSLSADSMRL